MKSATPTPSTNPFEKDVVHEPRDHPPSVSSLNQETLDRLLSQFRNVNGSGQSATQKAELILSPAPGYGKSHLVGRFFKELGNQAVRVYVPPFETTSTYWQSILLLTVDELDQAADWDSRGFEEPTQLDAFAERCFGRWPPPRFAEEPSRLSEATFLPKLSRVLPRSRCETARTGQAFGFEDIF